MPRTLRLHTPPDDDDDQDDADVTSGDPENAWEEDRMEAEAAFDRRYVAGVERLLRDVRRA